MGDEGNTPPGRRPPRERRTRLGRRKQPVLGRKAKPPAKPLPSDEATPETKRPPSGEATPAEKTARPPSRTSRPPKPARKPKPERKPKLGLPSLQRKARPERKPRPKRKPRPEREPAPRRAAASPATESRGEVISRRISAVVILVVIAVVIMALTDAAPFFDDVTEEQRVEDTVERFFAAYAERDFETVCSLFSPQVVQGIEQAGATETGEGQIGGCPEVLEARFGAADGEETKLDVKIEGVRVSGPRAVADVIVKTEEAPKGRPLPVELERGPEGWLVTRQVITD